MKQNQYNETVANILKSRTAIPHGKGRLKKSAEEGGCGVTGFIASVPVRGKHIYEPSIQMHNRGNGKGGGIAAVGLDARDVGIPQDVLDSHYLLQVALLDTSCQREIEESFINPYLDVYQAGKIETVDDYREIDGLEVKPPDVMRYVVRVKQTVLDRFSHEHHLERMAQRKAEDEFIYQNSVRLNHQFYASLGNQRAFVLSQGRNMMILKIVGYAEKVVQYYCLENFRAHGWIAHQRYPTKGRVWHPGGAHPFSGLNEALVHNGDFANYYSVSEYLSQHNIYPQFLTDTEVAILAFDLLSRTFEYPMEYIIEALAPTTEHDFDRLPPEKQRIYRYIQSTHIHASPDGPWFFIIARNDVDNKAFQLMGITDTSMLRPQVFALQEGKVQIGLVCSEKQAIDATLQSLSSEDPRFCPVADKYWNARGGSATDGGAFIFTVQQDGNDRHILSCTNKFGEKVDLPKNQYHNTVIPAPSEPADAVSISEKIKAAMASENVPAAGEWYLKEATDWEFDSFSFFCSELTRQALKSDASMSRAIEILTILNDRRFPTGTKKRSAMLSIIKTTLSNIFSSAKKLNDSDGSSFFSFIDWDSRLALRPPKGKECILIINTRDFQPEGENCDARLICDAYTQGWNQFICYGYRGQRFCGCGLSADTDDVRIDVYDSSGDYLASGIDGLSIFVHGNGQDQLGQIMKRGKLVVYGDVGQTFMYGAKGGEVYVMGNAAGRPLINAVGAPRVVINGTCLDYLAESFMAGDPLKGGGFVILNGIRFDDDGAIVDQVEPYPGSNLFSLASGGAIYLRDPLKSVVDEQLNGGELVNLSEGDWELILPYLQENERLFGISVENDLLTVNGKKMDYASVYRKVQAVRLDVLAKASTAVEEWGDDWQEAV